MSIRYEFTHEFTIGGSWAADMEIRAEIEPDWECGGFFVQRAYFETIIAAGVPRQTRKEWVLIERTGPAMDELDRQVRAALQEDPYHVGRIEAALAEENLISPVDLQTYDEPRVL